MFEIGMDVLGSLHQEVNPAAAIGKAFPELVDDPVFGYKVVLAFHLDGLVCLEADRGRLSRAGASPLNHPLGSRITGLFPAVAFSGNHIQVGIRQVFKEAFRPWGRSWLFPGRTMPVSKNSRLAMIRMRFMGLFA